MKRIQRKRTKGWKMPPNTVYVGRPTKWGNPYKIGELGLQTREEVIRAYAKWLRMKIHEEDSHFLDPLKGKDLACWCPLDKLCHADILLEFLKSKSYEHTIRGINMTGFEELPTPKVLEVRHLRLEKDGTRYEMMAFRLEGDVSFGAMGSVTDGWLVVSHLNRRAYLFRKDGFLDDRYVYEKLCSGTHPLSDKDAENMTQLLRKLLGQEE